DYDLEYGTDRLELHEDAIVEGNKVLLVDDLIATGGTAEAAIRLIERLGGEVVACSFVIDLPDLGGRARLEALGKEVLTLVSFEGE
ncbi:MAG TPA: adenine phosphoribosyltransferase, partial [Alphaproteobacteria bacterium]|nr:adenine phosphoribosyltransferase [Alphaproteobacteria bacterium]